MLVEAISDTCPFCNCLSLEVELYNLLKASSIQSVEQEGYESESCINYYALYCNAVTFNAVVFGFIYKQRCNLHNVLCLQFAKSGGLRELFLPHFAVTFSSAPNSLKFCTYVPNSVINKCNCRGEDLNDAT